MALEPMRIRDGRPRDVVFVAHCMLDPTTRYLGAWAGPQPDVLARWRRQDVSIIQMRCPEELAWGGVDKRRILRLYGARRRHPTLWPLLGGPVVWLALVRTRQVYRRLARDVRRQIQDRLASGYNVVGVLGVARSPSCGILTTIPTSALSRIARVDPNQVDAESQRRLVRDLAVPGQGMFTRALRAEFARHGLQTRFLEEDLDAPVLPPVP